LALAGVPVVAGVVPIVCDRYRLVVERPTEQLEGQKDVKFLRALLMGFFTFTRTTRYGGTRDTEAI
jgi:hypothetical protein